MATREQEWEELLGIKTSGRDDSHSDGETPSLRTDGLLRPCL